MFKKLTKMWNTEGSDERQVAEFLAGTQKDREHGTHVEVKGQSVCMVIVGDEMGPQVRGTVTSLEAGLRINVTPRYGRWEAVSITDLEGGEGIHLPPEVTSSVNIPELIVEVLDRVTEAAWADLRKKQAEDSAE